MSHGPGNTVQKLQQSERAARMIQHALESIQLHATRVLQDKDTVGNRETAVHL